jgi:hypothetical protein
MTTYVVTGQFINVKTMTRDGWRIIGLGVDSQLPDDVSPEHIRHLLNLELIAEVPEPEPVAAERPTRSVPSRSKVSDAD